MENISGGQCDHYLRLRALVAMNQVEEFVLAWEYGVRRANYEDTSDPDMRALHNQVVAKKERVIELSDMQLLCGGCALGSFVEGITLDNCPNKDIVG